MRVLVLLCMLAGTARADVAWGVHLGGGVEGGTITGVPRPDGLAEAGMILELIDADSQVGVAASVDAVGRQTDRFSSPEEVHTDLMIRWTTAQRKLRFGIGAGLRAIEQPQQLTTIHGLDMLHFDIAGRLATWRKATALDVYASWSFGCYTDTVTMPGTGDAEPTTRRIHCGDTITSSMVIGLRTSLSFR